MKKITILIFCILLCCTGCLRLPQQGNVDSVQIEAVGSALYSQADIDAAIAVILKDFKAHFTDCTLTRIAYAGDEITKKEIEWHREGYEESWGAFDKLIILLSDFTANRDIGGLVEGEYQHWNWILVRENCGSWRHVDHGYG